VPVLPSLGTNVASIAATLGIPKETVRRKISELIEAGWLVRRRGRLYLTAQAYRGLVPLRDRLMVFTVRCWEIVSRLRGEQVD
jgi:DNA-binding IclR family transcriptional regulator